MSSLLDDFSSSSSDDDSSSSSSSTLSSVSSTSLSSSTSSSSASSADAKNKNNKKPASKAKTAAAATNTNTKTKPKPRAKKAGGGGATGAPNAAAAAAANPAARQSEEDHQRIIAQINKTTDIPPPPSHADSIPILQGYRQLNRNPNLSFPKGINWNPFDLFFEHTNTVTNVTTPGLPRGKHRTIDLFLFACDSFYYTLECAIHEQKKKRTAEQLRNGFKFKWMNSGPVAENFAVLCDQAKLLHQQLLKEVGPTRDRDCPHQYTFMHHMLRYVQAHSFQREEELPVKTYEIKLKDWEKGGTRYNTDNADDTQKSNFVFAAADKRMEKLKEYIDWRVKVAESHQQSRNKNNNRNNTNNNENNNNMMMMGNNNNNNNQNDNQDDANNNNKTSNEKDDDEDEEDIHASLMSLLPASLLQASATRVTTVSDASTNQTRTITQLASSKLQVTSGANNNKLNEDDDGQNNNNNTISIPISTERNYNLNPKYPEDNEIRKSIYMILGGIHNVVYYPLQQKDKLGEYITHCQNVQDPEFRAQLLTWIIRSGSRGIHQAFEKLQGLAVVRRWVDELLLYNHFDVILMSNNSGTSAEHKKAIEDLKKKVHPETRKLTFEQRRIIILDLLDKMKHLQCICEHATQTAWFGAVSSKNPNSANRNNLNWLRRALDVSTEKLASKNQIIFETERMLTRTVADLTRQMIAEREMQQQQQNYSNNQVTLLALGGGGGNRPRSMSNSTSNLLSSIRPTNSAALNRLARHTSSMNNNGRMTIRDAREHESYKEQKIKNAMELFLQDKKNGGLNNSNLNNHNRGFLTAQQQQMIARNSSNNGGKNNNNTARFDETYRGMPRGKATDEIFAILDNRDNNDTNDEEDVPPPVSDAVVLSAEAGNFDPWKLLGVISN